jgi:multimeric flavodoxin WrbA
MTDKPKIIGICGSPHPNGNTAKLIKKILEGCKQAGAEIEFIPLGNRKISFCKACYECIKNGKCILDDDLNKIRKEMLESQGLVIGSPAYNREITGQLKTFFDRFFYDIHKQTFLGKYAVCVSSYMFSPGCTQKTLRDLTMALGYYVVDMINANLRKFNNEIEKDRKTMKNAFNIGLKLVKVIKTQKKYLKQDLIRKFFMKPIFKKIDRLMEAKGLF